MAVTAASPPQGGFFSRIADAAQDTIGWAVENPGDALKAGGLFALGVGISAASGFAGSALIGTGNAFLGGALIGTGIVTGSRYATAGLREAIDGVNEYRAANGG